MRVFGANTFNQMQNIKREFVDEDNRKVNTAQNEVECACRCGLLIHTLHLATTYTASTIHAFLECISSIGRSLHAGFFFLAFFFEVPKWLEMV